MRPYQVSLWPRYTGVKKLCADGRRKTQRGISSSSSSRTPTQEMWHQGLITICLSTKYTLLLCQMNCRLTERKAHFDPKCWFCVNPVLLSYWADEDLKWRTMIQLKVGPSDPWRKDPLRAVKAVYVDISTALLPTMLRRWGKQHLHFLFFFFLSRIYLVREIKLQSKKETERVLNGLPHLHFLDTAPWELRHGNLTNTVKPWHSVVLKLIRFGT